MRLGSIDGWGSAAGGIVSADDAGGEQREDEGDDEQAGEQVAIGVTAGVGMAKMGEWVRLHAVARHSSTERASGGV